MRGRHLTRLARARRNAVKKNKQKKNKQKKLGRTTARDLSVGGAVGRIPGEARLEADADDAEAEEGQHRRQRHQHRHPNVGVPPPERIGRSRVVDADRGRLGRHVRHVLAQLSGPYNSSTSKSTQLSS